MEYNHSEIYSLAKHYDLINDFDYDVDFLFEHSKGKTLELACGTGRVTLPLHCKGVEIVGIDVSEEMLQLARKKAFKKALNIDFIKKDIINFSLGVEFNTIFCIHNSFSHINGFENVKSFFENVKKHLADDGIFILQVFNPDFFFFTRNPNDKFPLKTYKDPESNKTVELSENSFYDEESQINYLKWYFKIGDREFVQNWSQRVYYPKELDYIVQFCGFEIIDKYGDFDKGDFENDSETQILVLKKKL